MGLALDFGGIAGYAVSSVKGLNLGIGYSRTWERLLPPLPDEAFDLPRDRPAVGAAYRACWADRAVAPPWKRTCLQTTRRPVRACGLEYSFGWPFLRPHRLALGRGLQPLERRAGRPSFGPLRPATSAVVPYGELGLILPGLAQLPLRRAGRFAQHQLSCLSGTAFGKGSGRRPRITAPDKDGRNGPSTSTTHPSLPKPGRPPAARQAGALPPSIILGRAPGERSAGRPRRPLLGACFLPCVTAVARASPAPYQRPPSSTTRSLRRSG